jgi:hypothetical protein
MSSSAVGNVRLNIIAATILGALTYLISLLFPEMNNDARIVISGIVFLASYAIWHYFIVRRFKRVAQWLVQRWRHLVIAFLLILLEAALYRVYTDWKIVVFSIAHFALIAVAIWLLTSKDYDEISWRYISHPSKVVAMATINSTLFSATEDDKLWMCEPCVSGTSWKEIGHAQEIVTMTASKGKLFAITRRGILWKREPVPRNIGWNDISQPENEVAMNARVVTMTAINSDLFAATRDRLLVCDLDASEISWKEAGEVKGIAVMTTFKDKLLAKTQDNRLLMYNPNVPLTFWKEIGRADNVVAMSAIKNTVFAVKENRGAMENRETMEFQWQLDGLRQESRWTRLRKR